MPGGKNNFKRYLISPTMIEKSKRPKKLRKLIQLFFNPIRRDTNLTSLPLGFVELFSGVAHFSMDLRGNRMQEIDQRVFYNNTLMEDRGTRILEGESGDRFFSFCAKCYVAQNCRNYLRIICAIFFGGNTCNSG